MSSITIVYIQLIILISNIIFIQLTTIHNQCDLSSAINLQTATYIHSLILRVQPIHSSEEEYKINRMIIRKVLVKEVIKLSKNHSLEYQVKMNDIIIIRINDDDNKFFNDPCWNLLRVLTVDIILFLNETNTNQFDLYYPPVESTLRVREHIETVLNYETYSPQVLIKTRLDKAIVSKNYSLQCNSRGNPLPRLLWSKKPDGNKTLEYYPLSKQCKSFCRIYSIQNKYQSILYFQPLTIDDIGTYVCHATNPMNHTTTNVYLNIDDYDDHNYQYLAKKDLACSTLKNCHKRGQCITVENQLKCLCDSGYFGEQCETSYNDIVKKQDNAMILFKSRFLAGCILVFVAFILILIALLSWYLAKNNPQQQRKKLKTKLQDKTSTEKPLITPVKDIISSTENKVSIPSLSSPIKQITKSSSPVLPVPPVQPPPPASASATIEINQPSIFEKNPLIPPAIPRTNIQRTITRESSTATDDDDDDGINNYLRHYQTLPPVPNEIDEEYEERFSLKMNKSEELGLGCLMNGINTDDVSLSHGYHDYYQKPDNQIGLIKPLDMRKDPPQRYTKYVSSYSKFVLPRPIKPSSSFPPEYQ